MTPNLGGIDYNGGIGYIVETQNFASLQYHHIPSNHQQSTPLIKTNIIFNLAVRLSGSKIIS